MCELILNTVGNPDFVRLLDGEDDCPNYLNRAQILVDLYLNTPDKGLNETPLHFAVKFGLTEVVQVLVSYPQCLKTARNKYNQIPADVSSQTILPIRCFNVKLISQFGTRKSR